MHPTLELCDLRSCQQRRPVARNRSAKEPIAGATTTSLPSITPYYVKKVGHVSLIPCHRPGDARVAELVAHRIEAMAARGMPIRAVMLERLGPNVWHRSPAESAAALEELEESAKLWLFC